jgi:pimeloyl-ACP methyl ester carboxylesterase
MGAFAERYRVVRYDLRGFGRSDLPTAPFSNADEAVAVLDALDVDRAALVGSSMGGGIAVEVAATHPERVAALVPVGGSPMGYRDWSEEIREMWKRSEAAFETGDLDTAMQIELDFWVPTGSGDPGDEVIAEIAQGARSAWEIDEDLERGPEVPTIERLEDIRAPTLVIYGDRDAAATRTAGDLLADRIPGARKHVMPGDHLPSLRHPEVFNRVVLAFLDEVHQQAR